jgi:hypothetical protein
MDQLELPNDCIQHIKSFLYIHKVTKLNQMIKRSVNCLMKTSYNMYTIHKYNIFIPSESYIFMFWYGHKHYQPMFCLQCGNYLYARNRTNAYCICKIESYTNRI